LRFGEVFDRLERYESMISNMRDRLNRRDLNVKRLERRAISPINELVDENKKGKSKDFNHASIGQGVDFENLETKEIKVFNKMINSTIEV
jgi:hypothetical protein